MESQTANSALKQLQDQIEAVRAEAYREGYAAAMAAVRQFVQETPVPPPRVHYAEAQLTGVGGFEEVRPRGTNRKLILELLQPIQHND